VSDDTGLRGEFLLDPDVTFLNHGSFGACPRAVFERYQEWQLELEREPVLFIARRLDGLLAEARAALGEYVGADPDDLVFVPNATSGVNIAAWPLGLQPGDEVLSTNLEYGGLDLAWEHVCGDFGARYVRTPIPLPIADEEEVVETIWAGVNKRTRVLFLSHHTSATALTLPVAELCRRAREREIVTVIDGAHVPGHLSLNLRELGLLRGQLPQMALRTEGRRLPLRAARAPAQGPPAGVQLGLRAPGRRVRRAAREAGHTRSLCVPGRSGRDRMAGVPCLAPGSGALPRARPSRGRRARPHAGGARHAT
jgi:hypothetical protein